MGPVKIRHVGYADILGPQSTREMLSEYAAECQLAEADPQLHMYDALERCGALGCYGAYVDEELIGFVSVLVSVMPHHGLSVGTIESLFVRQSFRSTGAADALLMAAEIHALEQGCISILYTARAGSPLATVLSRRRGCKRTHEVFTRWLNVSEQSPADGGGIPAGHAREPQSLRSHS